MRAEIYKINRKCIETERMINEIYEMIDKYIAGEISVEGAKADKQILESERDKIYSMIPCIYGNTEEYLKDLSENEMAYSTICKHITTIIEKCNSIIGSIDRYIAEYYCEKVENAAFSNKKQYTCTYDTSFRL